MHTTGQETRWDGAPYLDLCECVFVGRIVCSQTELLNLSASQRSLAGVFGRKGASTQDKQTSKVLTGQQVVTRVNEFVIMGLNTQQEV